MPRRVAAIAAAATSAVLLGLLAVGIPAVFSLNFEERVAMLQECKDDIFNLTDGNVPKNEEEIKECYDTCMCMKMDLITFEGQMPKEMPEMMNLTITEEQYKLLINGCDTKVKTTEFCKKSPVMLACVKAAWTSQTFPCFGVVP